MEYMGFVNLTPFSAEELILTDESGAEVLTIIVKATYKITDRGQIGLADSQVPVNMAGEYYGEPDSSSLKYDSEVAFIKVATDVVLIGHACSQKPTTELDISLKAGPLKKTARVFGDRFWTKMLGFKGKTSPKPFDRIPLKYELAFGGSDRTSEDPRDHSSESRNPVGVGFFSGRNGKYVDESKLPNIEDPAHLIDNFKDCPPPAGFGFMSPHWQSRRQYAGTYDEKWTKKRMPLLPLDFDRKFFNSAHPDLIAKGFFRGGEPIEIINASPRGKINFTLPAVTPEGVVMMKDQTRHPLLMNLDTVIINTDEDLLFLIWRGSMGIHKKLHKILWCKAQLKRGTA